jgi:adenylosuccinate synthase
MATYYNIKGEETQELPYDLCDDDCKPVYESFEGWNSSLERVATYGMLPEKAQEYITELEQRLEVPVTMVSTGPGRRQLLEKVAE